MRTQLRRPRLWGAPGTFPAGSLPWSGQPDQVPHPTQRLVPGTVDAAEHLNDLFQKLDTCNLQGYQKTALTSMRSFSWAGEQIRAVAPIQRGTYALTTGTAGTKASSGDEATAILIDGTTSVTGLAAAPDGSLHVFDPGGNVRIHGTSVTALGGALAGTVKYTLRHANEILAVDIVTGPLFRLRAFVGGTYANVALPAGTYNATAIWSGASNGETAVLVPRNQLYSANDFLVYRNGVALRGGTYGLDGKYIGCGWDEVNRRWLIAMLNVSELEVYAAADPTSDEWVQVAGMGAVYPGDEMDFACVAGVLLFAAGSTSRTAEFPSTGNTPWVLLFASVDSGATWLVANAVMDEPASATMPLRICPRDDGSFLLVNSDSVARCASLTG